MRRLLWLHHRRRGRRQRRRRRRERGDAARLRLCFGSRHRRLLRCILGCPARGQRGEVALALLFFLRQLARAAARLLALALQLTLPLAPPRLFRVNLRLRSRAAKSRVSDAKQWRYDAGVGVAAAGSCIMLLTPCCTSCIHTYCSCWL
jgi:hypothetical protein